MAKLKVTVEFTCGLKMELGREDGMVTTHMPMKRFEIEPAKAILVAKVMTALAEYPSST